jgi:UDP-N-acetylmuramate: L-alanyl-gamma-D-glutamyl-meso-diaminopimelate ligase
MHIHILGICGTFMGSLAVIAKQLGHRVSGSDENVYPPMSTQLASQGIELSEGYTAAQLQPRPDLVIIGNALTRGNPAVEYILNEGIHYTSGPQWLSQYVLHDKWVIGIAGTHGKTTTSAMAAWILEYAGYNPGYLIGGVANSFPTSATLRDSSFFVVEADEYDTAFFDKRSKFVHYSPRTAVINNLEFDHADIFEDLDAIKKQFHHLIRTIPGTGKIIHPYGDRAIDSVLSMGSWTKKQQFGVAVPNEICQKLAANGGTFWNAELHDEHGGEFELIKYGQGSTGEVVSRSLINWQLTGLHNVKNAMAAVAAAHHVGVDVTSAAEALMKFEGVKRRMEMVGNVGGVYVYDDFAHHPTAIETTLRGMAAKLPSQFQESRLIAVIEPRSNTMKMGVHQDQLVAAAQCADMIIWQTPERTGLNFPEMISKSKTPAYAFREVDEIIAFLEENTRSGDHVVIMSNGGFGGIHQKLLHALK